MSAYDYNPSVCLEVFHGIAEEIPSGVSVKDMKPVYPKIKFTQEILNYISNTIVTLSKKDLDGIWINYNIAEKLKYLEELEQKSPKTIAWRPKTGCVNLNSIKAKNLIEQKMELIRQIELVREESAMISPYLKTFSEQANEQLKEIDQIEKSYIAK